MEGGPEGRENDEGKVREESLEELRERLSRRYPKQSVEQADHDSKQTHPEPKGEESKQFGASDIDKAKEFRAYLKQKYDFGSEDDESGSTREEERAEHLGINRQLGAPKPNRTADRSGEIADGEESKLGRQPEELRETHRGTGREDRPDPEGPPEINRRRDTGKVVGTSKADDAPRGTESKEPNSEVRITHERIAEEDMSKKPMSSLEENRQAKNERDYKLPEYLREYYSKAYSDDVKSRAPTILSRACERPTASGPVIRFELPTRYVEKRSGITFRENRLYRITGKVESTGDTDRAGWNFEVYRVGKEHLKLRIHLPNRYHESATPGYFYRVTIDSVREMKATENPKRVASLVQHGARWSPLQTSESKSESSWRQSSEISNARNLTMPDTRSEESEVRTEGQTETAEKRELLTKPIEWKTMAAWMDTEGYLHTREGRQRRYELVIRQTEAKPLQSVQKFLQEQGMDGSKLKWRINPHYTAGGIFELRVKAIRDIDRIVSNTESFLITSIRRNQYERYRSRRQEAENKIEFNQNESGTHVRSELIDWKVVATWIDAEGNLNTRERPHSNRDYLLDVSQKEKAPLESLCSFLSREGIKANVVSRPHEMYSLQVGSVSDLDKIVSRTEPFIMRNDKRLQYEKYKNRRTRTPRRGPRPKPFST